MSVACVVSSTNSKTLTNLLEGMGITLAPTFVDAKSAKEGIVSLDPDFIFVNAPLSDSDGLDLCDYIQKQTLASTVLFVNPTLDEKVISQVEAKGVMVLKKPLSIDKVLSGIRYLSAVRQRTEQVEKENKILREQLEETRIVSRAKLLLVQYLGMSEYDAHKYIEKNAMDRRVKKSVIAKEIINTYEN